MASGSWRGTTRWWKPTDGFLLASVGGDAHLAYRADRERPALALTAEARIGALAAIDAGETVHSTRRG